MPCGRDLLFWHVWLWLRSCCDVYCGLVCVVSWYGCECLVLFSGLCLSRCDLVAIVVLDQLVVGAQLCFCEPFSVVVTDRLDLEK